ncbi:phosphoribosylanthranilate isomerase [Alcaligenaceae bacterium A4P071]|nr:phosphoribosylanthranilate isomerase [Alcaligenaceae bacterium A4P071]
MRTRIKICGLTREEDVVSAAVAGADAIGMVFYPKSKRYVTPERAAVLRRALPPFVQLVALFVNASDEDVERVVDVVRPDLLQFHGDETPEQCARFGHPYLRAFRVGAAAIPDGRAVLAAVRPFAGAAGWLFDSDSAGYGGSGHGFDHGLLTDVRAEADAPRIILSGGLTPDSVCAAIRHTHPWAVDVSSGVEQGPGIKDKTRINAFVAAVRSADETPIPKSVWTRVDER